MHLSQLILGVTLASMGLARAATSTPTVDLFIHQIDPNTGWAASIINACNGSTTYALACTSAPLANECGSQDITITEASDYYAATTPALYQETSAIIAESCSLDPTASSASCVATVVETVYGNNVQTTTGWNITNGQYYTYKVAVTAGAQKTDGLGTCQETESIGVRTAARPIGKGAWTAAFAVALIVVGVGVL